MEVLSFTQRYRVHALAASAGATPNGRPYFVMDLVKGIPLIRFFDEQRLSVRERLELFIQVCQAVQYAHQEKRGGGKVHVPLDTTSAEVEEEIRHLLTALGS